jgi:hypothetical protein
VFDQIEVKKEDPNDGELECEESDSAGSEENFDEATWKGILNNDSPEKKRIKKKEIAN